MTRPKIIKIIKEAMKALKAEYVCSTMHINSTIPIDLHKRKIYIFFMYTVLLIIFCDCFQSPRKLLHFLSVKNQLIGASKFLQCVAF